MLVAVHENPGLNTTKESTMSFFFAARLGGNKWKVVQLLLHSLHVLAFQGLQK
jgi:hypothetical protein